MFLYFKKIEMIRVFLVLIVSCFLLTSCENKMSGQEIIDHLSNEMCLCIELAEYKNATEIEPCHEELFTKNRRLAEEFYHTDKLSDAQIFELKNKIAAKMLYTCKYLKENFPTGLLDKKVPKKLNLDCDKLKVGKFYYLTQRPDSKIQDTTFVTISKDEYLEKMRNNTTYSRLKIVWKDNCKYDLIFQESDDPLKKEMFHKGQVFNYEIINEEDESIFVEINWEGQTYVGQMFKIK